MTTDLWTSALAHLAAASSAAGSGDYDTAESELMQAEIELEGVPEGRQGTSEFRQARSRLDSIRNWLAHKRTGGIRQVKVKYVPTTG